MYRLLYSLLFYLLLPLVVARMLWRSRQAPAYRQRLGERLGLSALPEAARGGFWFHTVSVGETIACAPLIHYVLEQWPDAPVVVTTMTPTGSERVRQLFAERVFHVYLPWDTPLAMQRFCSGLQARLLVIMETELWPNMLHHAHRAGTQVLVVNARLSQRSADGYAKVGGLTREMLQSVSMVAVQTEAEAQRFRALGLAPESVSVTGSIKFDIRVPDALRVQADELRAGWGKRPVWVAASTHAGEDEPCLLAHTVLLKRFPNALLILVPRHPERFDSVAALCTSQGFSVARRSQRQNAGEGTQVFLGDTMGELMLFLACGDAAFVGGSLVENGGHNHLEPAALGLPVLSGPSQFNFQEIAGLLQQAGGMRLVDSGEALGDALCELFEDAELCAAMGRSAESVVAENRGALARVQSLLGEYWEKGNRS